MDKEFLNEKFNLDNLEVIIRNNYINTFKYLLKNNFKISKYFNEILVYLADYDRFDMLMYLIDELKNNNIKFNIVTKGIKKIKNKDGNIKLKPSSKNEAFIAACQSGNLDIVIYLVEEFMSSISIENAEINRAISIASTYGHLDIIKYLIQDFDKVKIRGFNTKDNINTALIYACGFDQLDIVKYIVEEFNINHETNTQAIIWASNKGYINIVEYLFESYNNATEILISASNYNHLDIVKLAINNGADIRAENDKALINACRNGNLEMVKLMNIKGINDKAIIETNFILRMQHDIDKRQNYYNIIEYLVLNGAQVQFKDTTFYNNHIIQDLSEYISKAQFSNEVINILLTNKDISNKALIYAGKNGRINIIKRIIEFGIMICSEIYYAFGNIIFKFDLDHFFDDNSLLLSLFGAITGDHFDIIKYLVEKFDTLIYIQNNKAIKLIGSVSSNIDIVKYFVEGNFNFRSENNTSITDIILKSAIEDNNYRVIEYITELNYNNMY